MHYPKEGKTRGLLTGVLIAALLIANAGYGQNTDQEITRLAAQIGKTLVAKQKPKLAVTDFSDLQGRPTEFGRFLAEQLSVEFVNTPGVSVVDRTHLKIILAEHKLSEEGLINPETAKKLGQFAGVDSILIGTVTQLDDALSITVKAISTDTAEIVAAGRATFAKTKETQQLVTRSLGTQGKTTTTPSRSAPTFDPIIREFGDLRITLSNVQTVKVDRNRTKATAIDCSFEFTNKHLQDSMLFAGNGEANYPDRVRAIIRNAVGEVFTASSSRGFTSVAVYGHTVQSSSIVQHIMIGKRIDGPRAYYPNERLWMGDLSPIPPGETIQASIRFEPPEQSRASFAGTDEVRIEFEFVVGVGNRPSKTFRLNTLVLDKVPVAYK